jgi:hypothetical protein
MSWLKLTPGYFYLMRGGANSYIDRVKIVQVEKYSDQIQGFIEEFPHEWFDSTIQRPRKIIVNLEEEIDGSPIYLPFTKNQILKRLETPVSYDFFEYLRVSKRISEFIKKFEVVVGTRFSDEFLSYVDSKSGKRWNVITKIKYSEDFEIKNFPQNPINSNDPEAEEEEPSFSDILFEVLWNEGFSIRPYLMSNPDDDSKIVVELNIFRPKALLAPQRTTISTLEKAIIPKKFKRKEENRKVCDVLKQISDERNITVNAPDDMADRRAEFNFDGQLTFTEVMDTIALNHGAFWDWQGRDSAFLRRTIPG